MSSPWGIWRHLPLMVRASLIGLIVAAAGELPWVTLAGANVRISPSIPWAVVVMGVWLYVYWKYFSGAGWPRSTQGTRIQNFRTRTLEKRIWFWSLGSGGSAVLSLIALEMLVLRIVHLPLGPDTQTSRIPLDSLLPLAVMSAFASAIPEEVGFRGYMQAPLERRYGPAFAIFFVAVVFGLIHLTHGLSIFLLFDVAFGLVYGIVAYCADSLLPGIALHCAFDIVLFVAGREIAAAMAVRPIHWNSGTDLLFWILSLAFLLLGGCAVYTFRTLAGITHPHPATV